jgi:hypothetical protein
VPPIAIGVLAGLYLINPIIQYDSKLSGGLTKEFSVGFGYFGEYRAGVEYSYIFRSNVRNSLKASVKYDVLLKDLEPSNMFQSSSVISLGGGYFTDFEDHGIFPEVSYGYSIRNHKLLFYPNVKLRHIWVFNKQKANITDVSFGITIGVANPFIDLNIRRE